MSARRLEETLGLSDPEAHRLLVKARKRLGRRGFAVRGLAFTLATGPLGRLLPRGLRQAAIRPLVYALIPGPTENLLYARVTKLPATGEETAGSR
ncbi:MAG TPA: hypothetical protein VFS64_10265 [Solirubrobacterales bacterium]|nr:hypothetical protein [Solirubrobacterales bacterium]